MKCYLFSVFTLLLIQSKNIAQPVVTDTLPAKELMEVIVKGYEQNSPLKRVGAAVSVFRISDLQQYPNTSILPALNAAPGIRMEERSPASYRLNIRGSSLRSPFGVRNVKIYWNDIPFTDPGGNTYLNQLSFYNFSSIEVLKGPGSSLYGAGTGGVMLIGAFDDSASNQVNVHLSAGSFASRALHVSAITGSKDFRSQLSYTHQSSDGYRVQSGMRRDVFTWDTKLKSSEKHSISTHMLYGDLYYQTPGALTLAQYNANPKAARPAGGGFPSAVDAQAAIFQKTFWTGVTQSYQFSDHFSNNTSIYGAVSMIRNPAIRNYEKRAEPHYGGRTSFTFSKTLGSATMKLVAGAEYQQGDFSIRVFKNNKGNPDSLQTDDEVFNRQLAVFAQSAFTFARGWILTAGLSYNKTNINVNRVSIIPNLVYRSSFSNQVAPRISLLKTINERLSLYAVFSKGYSPPTVAEVVPSTSVINTTLEPEEGYNYEAGLRGSLLGSRLSFQLNAYYFNLSQAIASRRDASNADYFVNVGGTNQKGLESAIQYYIVKNEYRLISSMTLQLSHTYNQFRYKKFTQNDKDSTGHPLPGVAPHTFVAIFSVESRPGIFVNLNYFYSDKIPLNDANSAFASDYHLVGFKGGYRLPLRGRLGVTMYLAGDNLLNEQYSLGNDINAAGNRFYNAAPGINYQGGIDVKFAL